MNAGTLEFMIKYSASGAYAAMAYWKEINIEELHLMTRIHADYMALRLLKSMAPPPPPEFFTEGGSIG